MVGEITSPFLLLKIPDYAYNTNKCSYFYGGDRMQISIGQIIEIIYLDKARNISQRKIEIHSIRDGRIRASCLTTGTPRMFLAANILSWQPVQEQRHA